MQHGGVNIVKIYYRTNQQQTNKVQYNAREPPPLKLEVERAIRATASKKAPGADNMPAELIKKAEKRR